MSNPKKEATIQSIQEKLQAAAAIVFADYRGLSAGQMEELRHSIAEANSTLQVLKNSLVKIALEREGYELPEESVLEGPTAVLFSSDNLADSFKAIAEFAEKNELPQIKGGYLEQQILPVEKITKIAKLPPINVLQAQVVGQLNAPITGLVYQLQGQLSGLVYTLQALKEKKQTDNA